MAGAVVLAAACSGTDVGYPRPSALTWCTSGGSQESGVIPMGGGGGTSAEGRGGAGLGGPSPSDRGGTSGNGLAPGNGGVSGAIGGARALEAGSSTIAGSGGEKATGMPPMGVAWPRAYAAGTLPTPATGHHNPGSGCMLSSCHGMKVPFVFGGTVYKADGTTPAASVEVAIVDAANTLTAYSASNGNLWAPTAPAGVDWANATIVIRNAKGEKAKPPSSPRNGNCNASGCHNSARRLLEP